MTWVRKPADCHSSDGFDAGTAAAGLAAAGLEGRWALDGERSDSMTDFLISVGAPRVIARLVGKTGKPVTIAVVGPDRKEVSVTVEGKAAEVLSVAEARPVETPGGQVSATLKADGLKPSGWGSAPPQLRSFTTVKLGPAEGEKTTEARELAEDGSMRCAFTHENPTTKQATTAVRYYNRVV